MMEKETEGSGDEEEQEAKGFSLNMIPLLEMKSLFISFAKKPGADRHLRIFILSLNL